MTTDDIERMARDGRPIPSPATLPDQCYWYTMRGIWADLRAHRLDAKAAAEAKRQALRAYAEYQAAYQVYCAFYARRQDAIRQIGTLRTDILRAGTDREKLRLALRALALVTGDDTICTTD